MGDTIFAECIILTLLKEIRNLQNCSGEKASKTARWDLKQHFLVAERFRVIGFIETVFR